MKKEIIPEFLWHLDEVVLSFQITIVTTVDREGRVYAAPFGLVFPFSTGSNPQILVGVNSRWHTAQNIEATGEFVVNYASYPLLEKVAQTGLLYPEGINELDKSGLTALPALKVMPPRVEECYQHFECRLSQIIRPNENQMNVVGDIVAISINEDLVACEENIVRPSFMPNTFFIRREAPLTPKKSWLTFRKSGSRGVSSCRP